jgi:hypothetical protein
MVHASGFAPNHNGDILSLACCKPGIREKAEVGDWIAGFTSTAKTAGATPRGHEKLIYLMKVTDKMTFNDYWEKYPKKRTEFSSLGDNIYHKNKKGEYDQEPNPIHFYEHKKRDLSSEMVLISTNYKYFGKVKPLDISNYKNHIKIPYGVSRWGQVSENDKVIDFIDFVLKQESKSDINYSAFLKKKSSSFSKK